MIKVLFVCHGNICRSPMAEFIFKDMVARRGIAEQFHISSAATSQEEIGNPVYPPAVRELARHGISAAGKRAVQLRVADYGKYDLLLAMEQYNRTNMMKILKEDPEGKVRLLLDFTRSARRHRRSLVLWPVRPDLCGHLPWLRRTVDHTGILTPLTNAPPNRAGRFLRHCPFCLFFSRFLIQVSCISTFLLI